LDIAADARHQQAAEQLRVRAVQLTGTCGSTPRHL
jgi:hypothetical protein